MAAAKSICIYTRPLGVVSISLGRYPHSLTCEPCDINQVTSQT